MHGTIPSLRHAPSSRSAQLSPDILLKFIVRDTAGFRREVAQNCVLLGCYAASSGIKSHHYSLRNNPEERSFYNKNDGEAAFHTVVPTGVISTFNSECP